MLGPLLGLEGMVGERMMKRVRKRRVMREKAAQLQVPGPDQRRMEEGWWMEGEWTGPEESWRGVGMGGLEGRRRGVGRSLQLEPVGRRTAAAQREDNFDLHLHSGWAVGRLRRDRGG